MRPIPPWDYRGASLFHVKHGGVSMPVTFQPVLGVVQSQIKCHFDGRPGIMIMTIHTRGSGDFPTEADCSDANTLLAGWFNTNLRPIIATQWQLFSIYSKSMAIDPPPFAALPVTDAGMAGDTKHPEAAPEVVLHTGIAGRSYFSKKSAFGPDDGAITEDGFTSPRLVSYGLAWENLISLAVTATHPLVVPSKKHNFYHLVTDAVMQNRYTIQKRRRLGFGG
jgi:hypothetical protein